MLEINSIEELDKINESTAVALGMFDGLHIGHQAVINNMIDNAHKRGLKSCVLTFQNHPKELTSDDPAPQRILSKEDKVGLMSEYGVDILVILPFNEYILNMSAMDFIKDIISNKLKAKFVCAGFDYHFGYKAMGDVDMLTSSSSQFGYEFQVINPILHNNEKISSSSIRQLLYKGNVSEVENELGRHHFVSGIVVKGKQLGNKLGFPTANLEMSANMNLIRAGVYITRTKIDGVMHNSITNVGNNPTFHDTFRIETHILNYDEMIYGKKIYVFFYKRIRGEQKFNSMVELIDMMNRDKNIANEYFQHLC